MVILSLEKGGTNFDSNTNVNKVLYRKHKTCYLHKEILLIILQFNLFFKKHFTYFCEGGLREQAHKLGEGTEGEEDSPAEQAAQHRDARTLGS